MLGASQVVVVGYINQTTGDTLCASCAGKSRELRTRNVDTPAWRQVIQYEADEANSEGAYECDEPDSEGRTSDDWDYNPHGYGYTCDECGEPLEGDE